MLANGGTVMLQQNNPVVQRSLLSFFAPWLHLEGQCETMWTVKKSLRTQNFEMTTNMQNRTVFGN